MMTSHKLEYLVISQHYKNVFYCTVTYFNIRPSIEAYSHYKHKMFVSLYYLYNDNSYTGNKTLII